MFRRMREGWELTKKSWSVIRRQPKQLRLTITGGVMALLVAVVVGGPGLWLSTSDIDSTRYVGWALLGVASYLASFFGVDDEARGPFERSELAAAAN